MTAITTISVDHAAVPTPLNSKDHDAVARMIEAALRDEELDAMVAALA